MARAAPFIHDRPAAEAFAAWEEACAAAGCPARVEAVTVPLDQAVGRVTAEPVWATRSSPPFDAAAMDGIAVRAADTVGASETSPIALSAGSFEVVDTGDPVPGDFDAVVMREDVHEVGDGVELRAAAAPYQHVRSIGEDVSAAELLLPAGHRLRPVDVAAAGAAGASELSVRRQPVVTVIPTGDEIRPVGTELQPGELPDTNSLMVAAQAEAGGCEAHCFEVVPDEPAEIAAAVRAAAARSDLVVVIAGSSAGRDDHTAAVVAEVGALAVHGVAVRPGHPVVLGVARDGGAATPVLGAPGYPVSAALTFDIFAAPLLARLEGAAPPEAPVAQARLARKLASTMGMDDWVRVRLGRVGGRLVATPLPRGAGVLTSLVRADGLLVVPAEKEGHHAGEEVTVRLLRGVGEIERTIVVTGSHDLVLDLAASKLREADPLVTLASSNVGSLGGLTALRDGLCHLAGSHLLDPENGEYTLPYVDRLMPDEDVAVVRLVHREQGLIVPPGNPANVDGIESVAQRGLRYVNRQRGAGTRALLDHELAKRGISPEAIQGYEREEHTHLAVAAAVSAGRADCGLGVLAAARAFELDFVPVAKEPYDLVLRAADLGSELLAPLWALLDTAEFRAEVTGLGGPSPRLHRARLGRPGALEHRPGAHVDLDQAARGGSGRLGQHDPGDGVAAHRRRGTGRHPNAQLRHLRGRLHDARRRLAGRLESGRSLRLRPRLQNRRVRAQLLLGQRQCAPPQVGRRGRGVRVARDARGHLDQRRRESGRDPGGAPAARCRRRLRDRLDEVAQIHRCELGYLDKFVQGADSLATAETTRATFDDVTDEQVASFHENGFLIVEEGLVPPAAVEVLRERFAKIFDGEYATGIAPDEVNWKRGRDREDVTRQLCNGWKADELLAAQVLSERTGRIAARLGGYRGTRMLQDNCLWKPPGTKSLGMHQDGSYAGYLSPPEMITCWVALDETRAEGGTIEYVRGSHKWPKVPPDRGSFHAPDDWLAPLNNAKPDGVEIERVPVVVKPGGCAFHHSLTFHGSGPNESTVERRALVSHLVPVETRFHPTNADLIYSRYRRRGDLSLDESFFPVLWDENGGRTAWLSELPELPR